MNGTRNTRGLVVAAALAVTVAACGGGSSGGGESGGGEAQTDYSDTWDKIEAPDECMCGDGSPWSYFVREADPTRVLFYLEGGGACFTADMCRTTSGSYKTAVGTGPAGGSGIFDLANPDNPFADWSIVFVPYCTGDVHAGDLTKDYGNDVVMEHKGMVNGTTALEGAAELFPGASSLVVAGSSAGAFPTPIYAGLASELWADADIKVFADSGGAIPDLMSAVISNWGTIEALPDWPQFEGIDALDFNPPFAFIAAAEHDPGLAFARHDYAFDEVLSGYATLAGLSADDLVGVMKAGEERIETAGTPVAAWIGPGDSHTILGRDALYTETLDGVGFLDWLVAFLEGEPLDDVYCTDCAG